MKTRAEGTAEQRHSYHKIIFNIVGRGDQQRWLGEDRFEQLLNKLCDMCLQTFTYIEMMDFRSRLEHDDDPRGVSTRMTEWFLYLLDIWNEMNALKPTLLGSLG
jgi:hypothetical protein